MMTQATTARHQSQILQQILTSPQRYPLSKLGMTKLPDRLKKDSPQTVSDRSATQQIYSSSLQPHKWTATVLGSLEWFSVED